MSLVFWKLRQATLNLAYQNDSPSETWPAGTYKNYLRVYCPQGSILKELKIDDQIIPHSDIETSLNHQKTIFGFLVKVPIKNTTQVSLSYRLPQKFNFQNQTQNYELYLQKQSGAKHDPINITVNFPQFFKIVQTSPSATVNPQQAIFKETLNQDKTLALEFINQ